MYTEGNTINSKSLSKAIKCRYIGCCFVFFGHTTLVWLWLV